MPAVCTCKSTRTIIERPNYFVCVATVYRVFYGTSIILVHVSKPFIKAILTGKCQYATYS